MEAGVQIEIQGEIPIHGLREKMAEHVASLEKRFGRIMSCRVVIRQPSGHHRTGPYDIHVHLALPQGKEVNVAQTPVADERYCDIDFAIHDAFKRARRQLQDRVARLQGKVKARRTRTPA